MDRRDRLRGVLLGTAIGDALGFPFEGMKAAAIARRCPSFDRYRLFGGTGFVSDDTEQSALVAQSLAHDGEHLDGCVLALRRALLGWFFRFPWGIGHGTLRACLRIATGRARSGVASAGNGAAMRAAIVGVFFADDDERRRAWVDALSRVTHTDPRAVEGARFVAEVAARCATTRASLVDVILAARVVVSDAELGAAIDRAMDLAQRDEPLDELGTSGFVVHSVALATYCFLRFGDDGIVAIETAVRAGGDTDSNAAIVGAWLGARHGEDGLPRSLVDHLQEGPFGRTHLRALADVLAGKHARATYEWPVALLRNIALFPVVFLHGLRVLLSLRMPPRSGGGSLRASVCSSPPRPPQPRRP